MATGYNPCGDVLAALLLSVADEEWERFGPTAAESFWIPDEVADAHGGEFLAVIPVGEA